MRANTTVRALLLAAALLGLGTPALAQQTVQLRNPSGNVPIGDDPARPLYVSSASGTGSSANQVQGTTAAGSTANGNPVRNGGVFNTSQPTYTTGQIGDLQIDANGNLRVALQTAPAAGITAATGSTVAAANVGSAWYSDTTSNLASAATFTGTSRDLGAGPIYGSVSFFGCQFNADQTGTATVQNSTNGTTWVTAATQAYTANTALDLNVRVRARYHRCLFVNGATAQTSFRVVSSFTAN